MFGTVVKIGALHRPGAPARVRCVSALRWGFLPLPATKRSCNSVSKSHAKPISSKVIYRATIDEITGARAKMKAAALLDLYAGRGANSARVLNPKNEIIFRL
jgi:hypothetical protein